MYCHLSDVEDEDNVSCCWECDQCIQGRYGYCITKKGVRTRENYSGMDEEDSDDLGEESGASVKEDESDAESVAYLSPVYYPSDDEATSLDENSNDKGSEKEGGDERDNSRKGKKRQRSPSPEVDFGVVSKLTVEFNDASDDEGGEVPRWKVCQDMMRNRWMQEMVAGGPRKEKKYS